ncbi:MAG: hypothetical protein IJO74_06940 [Clostridia bacterium]|nr:hypothetical protein [Clostridia bacterium]
MLGKTYSLLIIVAFCFALFSGNTDIVAEKCAEGAVNAVKFMLELGSMMALWCGIMAVFRECGILKFFSVIITPFTKVIFPNAYRRKEALEEISMNMGANFLGLGNAATPMGLNAVEKLSKFPDCTDDIIMLTVLNTASIQFLPTTLISLRIISGCDTPYEIVVPIWICSVLTVAFAILVTKTTALFTSSKKR